MITRRSFGQWLAGALFSCTFPLLPDLCVFRDRLDRLGFTSYSRLLESMACSREALRPWRESRKRMDIGAAFKDSDRWIT
jgi:hypothetical protein